MQCERAISLTRSNFVHVLGVFSPQDNFSSETMVPDTEDAETVKPKTSQVNEKKVDHVFVNNSYDDLRAGDFDFVMDEGKYSGSLPVLNTMTNFFHVSIYLFVLPFVNVYEYETF